jgi:acyl-CoA thioester hydrolase
MARMKIEMPQKWQFKTEIEIRVSDLNYGNHLANQEFLTYAQVARLKYFNKYGFTELDFGGVSLIQADAAVIFKGEGHLNDMVEISVSAMQSGNSSFNVFYQFWNKTKNQLMAEVRTAIVCFDYDVKRPVGIPQEVKDSGLFLVN